jgi:ferric-dicitrate binding protein FerR (iron transport regulator)
MTDEQDLIIAILVKYALRQPLDEAEERVLEEWRSRSEEHNRLPDQFRNARWLEQQRRQLELPPTAEMWEDIRRYVDESGEPATAFLPSDRRRIGWSKLAVAGLIGIIIMTGGVFWWKGKRPMTAPKLAFELPALIPLNFSAVLELSDGRMIGLDTVKKGQTVIADNGIILKKTDSNSYVYAGIGMGNSRYQRLSIAPGGGPLRIQWPDRSTAWLDKGSSLAYSTDLRGSEVRLNGEAWFRVAHDPGRPVTIRTASDATVRVLGTSFDVRSIAGSPERVALFSGKLQVSKSGDSVLLNPGGQLEATDQVLRVSHGVDSNAMLAWLRPAGKGDWIDFHNADLLTMLPEIAAWWRVTVDNPAQLHGVSITGEFRRGGSVADIIKQLKSIEDKYVQLTVKEDTIYVAPLRPGG